MITTDITLYSCGKMKCIYLGFTFLHVKNDCVKVSQACVVAAYNGRYLWTLFSSCPSWECPFFAPMHMWGIPCLQAWQVARLWEMHGPYSAFPPPQLFLFSFPCNVLWCSSSLDLVKRSYGVAWQQPSAALSFQSPCSAVRLPPESCQDFPLFLHRSTFLSALPNNSHIWSHSTLRVSPLPSSFPPLLLYIH